MDNNEDLAMLFCCEHATLITILEATVNQLRNIPPSNWHPSMAAVLMSVNALRASVTAARVHGNDELANILNKMYIEMTMTLKRYHTEDLSQMSEKRSTTEVPDAFKKAFE